MIENIYGKTYTESLKMELNITNYINYINNLVHKLDSYIHVFKEDIPFLYRKTKNIIMETTDDKEKNTAVFMMANGDDILIAMCVQFATDSIHLLNRKILEVHQKLSRSFQEGIMPDTVPISHDLIRYFSDYQQQLNWDELSYGTYGNHVYDGSDIYDLNAYLLNSEKRLEALRFNTISKYDYNKITEILDFGYRETLNTFMKLRKILDRSNSLYTAINIIHVYIDILLMMCYIIEYIYTKTLDPDESN